MSRIKIAVVQADYTPIARTSTSAWLPEEPLAPSDPLGDINADPYLLRTLRGLDQRFEEQCEQQLLETAKTYEDNWLIKLRELLSFCYHHRVDVVALPEYSVPAGCLRALHEFSKTMTMVAGIGYVRPDDLESLRELSIPTDNVQVGANAAVVLGPSGYSVVTKRSRADNEPIEEGHGPVTLDIAAGGRTLRLGVAICRDFLNHDDQYIANEPNLVVIPALTAVTRDFIGPTARNYLQVFANHSHYGGTCFRSPAIEGLRFADRDGTLPLPPGAEAVVILDWDMDHPTSRRPSSTIAAVHRVYARAALVHAGRDPALAEVVQQLSTLTEPPRQSELASLKRRNAAALGQAGKRGRVLNDALDALESSSRTITAGEVQCLTRHLVLSRRVLTRHELAYRQVLGAAAVLRGLEDVLPQKVAAAYGHYAGIAEELSADVREEVLDARHRSANRGLDAVRGREEREEEWIFYAQLGQYSDEARKTLPRQLNLLRTLADLQHPSLTLRYRLYTVKSTDDNMNAVFEIVCSVRGASEVEVEQLREGFGQLVGATFAGAYSLSYTVSRPDSMDRLTARLDPPKWRVEIRRAFDREGHVIGFAGKPDWALVVDHFRCLQVPVVLELECYSLESADLDSSASGSSGHLIGDGGGTSPTEVFLDTLATGSHREQRRLSVRVFVGSDHPLPTAVTRLVGNELAGPHPFELIETSGSPRASRSLNAFAFSPSEALQVFHPPYGDMYVTAGQGRPPLDIPVDVTDFPRGVALGSARARHARADRTVDVRLSSEDRFRHMYIVGKTGTGKTNFLKLLAEQDAASPSQGMTVIDPHGGLVDHVLKTVELDRLKDIVLVDLSRTDALPVLNPLDFDRTDLLVRDRTIQDLIGLISGRYFHEYTGPRFDEMVRLALHTLADPGYPGSPSLVEVPLLFTDEQYQATVRAGLQDEDLRGRWTFHDRMKQDHDYATTVDWMTSKFDELARDSTLRCVLGGARSTIDIPSIIASGRILLVKLPAAVVGHSSADFIGSAILLQLRMTMIRSHHGSPDGTISDAIPHYIYIDEFQNFATTDFDEIVAEARKFGLGFILAHQNLDQLREFRRFSGSHEQQLVNAILGNVANFVVFSVGALDAQVLSRQLDLNERDVMRIKRFEAVAKLGVGGVTTNAFTLRCEEAENRENPYNADEVAQRMVSGSVWIRREELLQQIADRQRQLRQKAQHDAGGQHEVAVDDRAESVEIVRVEDEDSGDGGHLWSPEWNRQRGRKLFVADEWVARRELRKDQAARDRKGGR